MYPAGRIVNVRAGPEIILSPKVGSRGTINSGKGLESKSVFLPNSLENFVPRAKQQQNQRVAKILRMLQNEMDRPKIYIVQIRIFYQNNLQFYMNFMMLNCMHIIWLT